MKSVKLSIIVTVAISVGLMTPAHAQAPKLSMEVIALHFPKQYAKHVIQQKGWSNQQYVCLNKIWTNESHWNYKAANPKSTAYGIAQLLIEKSKSPATQIRNGIRYISYRYGQPCKAWEFWRRHGWY